MPDHKITANHDTPDAGHARPLAEQSRAEAAAHQQALDRLCVLTEQLQRQIRVLAREITSPDRLSPHDQTDAECEHKHQESPTAQHVELDSAQWERQMAAKVEAMDALQLKLDQVRERQESQVGAYLAEIESLREQITEASTRFNNLGRNGRTKARHHQRFSAHSTHVIVEGLLSSSNRSEFLRGAIMDAPIFTRTNYQPVFKVRPDGEYHLTDFLALHDRNFVQAAYRAILRREADPEGATHYLEQVRSGESKAKLLDQFLHSEEGRAQRTVIHGLTAHLKLTRLCELPFVGRALEAVLFLANVRGHLRDLRVLENHVIRVAEEAQALHEANMIKLRSLSR